MKKNFIKFIVGVVLCITMGRDFCVTSYSEYDPNKAVDYAEKYAESPNVSVNELATNVKAGDIVLCWYGNKGEPRHTIICVEKTGNSKKKVFFASHSKNYKQLDLK